MANCYIVNKGVNTESPVNKSQVTFDGEYHANDIMVVELLTTGKEISGTIEILCNGIIMQTENVTNINYYGMVQIKIINDITGTIIIRPTNNNMGVLSVNISYNMTPMTENTTATLDGNIIASSSSVFNEQQSTQPYMAFNGVVGSDYECWHPEEGCPQWLSIEFPIPVCLKDFTMFNRTNYAQCPKDVIFQYSNDGINWIDIISFVFSTVYEANQSKTIKTNNITFCKYYRWYINTTTNSTSNYAVISEIKFDTIYRQSIINNNILIGEGTSVQNPETIAYSLQEAGYAVTDDPSTWGSVTKAKWLAYDYRLDYSGTIFVYGGRTVTRSTDKLAYCGWCTFSDGYFMAVLVSAYPEALEITMGGAVPLGIYEFTVDGQTVYWTVCGENSTQSSDSSGYNRRYLGQKTATTTGDEDMARKLYNEITMLGYSLYE